MWNLIWPILLVVASNVFYHITTKSTPVQVNPFISLVVTYLTAAVASFALFICTQSIHTLPAGLKQVNWTGYVLGIAIIGLETGSIYLYRAGWNVSIGSLVANIALAVCLIAVGTLFYKEVLGIKQIVGVVFCIAGLIFINMK